jgi:hypothetical protein
MTEALKAAAAVLRKRRLAESFGGPLADVPNPRN